MIKSRLEDFFDKLPEFDENIKKHFANNALDIATQEAKFYPPHMQDLIISLGVNDFIGSVVSLMVRDILYGNGTFKPLTENERVSANLLMFTDKLPEIAWEK